MTRTALYRHFSSANELLYIGISLSWPARTKAHSKTANWFDQVARVDIENHPTREAALKAEKAAIEREGPRFNVVHNRTRGRARKRKSQITDPLVAVLQGSTVLIGPPLVYRGDNLSLIAAHGEPGAKSTLTELTLGEFFEPLESGPLWDAADTVLNMRTLNHVTVAEGREKRSQIVGRLKSAGKAVQTFETDFALAAANMANFPSPEAAKIVDDIAADCGEKM